MTDDDTKNNDGHLDLDWLAFCYIANELPEQEMLEFQKRLAQDQAARDAVVRAMELSQLTLTALSACPSTQAEPARSVSKEYTSTRHSRASRLVFAASICLAFLTAGWAIYSNSQNAGIGLAAEVESLATVWAKTAEPADEGWELEMAQTDELNDADWEFEATGQESDSVPMVDEQTASWMFDALTILDESDEGTEE